MKSLVIANISERPTRTIVSLLGISLGVVLVMIFAGLVNGMQSDRSHRESNIGADITFSRDFSLTTTSLSLPIQYKTKLDSIPGVAITTPIGHYLKESSSGIGFEILEGIDYDTYSRMSGLTIIQGTPLINDFDVIVDEQYAADRKVKVGNLITLFSREFHIVGIYSPESGARIKIKLSSMQKLLASPDRCTSIYIKCISGENVALVAKHINDILPGNKVIPMEDILQLYEKGIPAFNALLKTVVGVAVVISFLVILLSMYTTITERTREIGILKSLGASKAFIVLSIEAEALFVCFLGIFVGYLASFITKVAITKFTSLKPEIELKWMFYAAIVSLVSSFIGAFYPALRAASQDPVEALSYE